MRKPPEMGAFSIPSRKGIMAAAKTQAKPKSIFTEKSKSKDQFGCFAVTLLIEDASKTNRPNVVDYLHDILDDDYDGLYGDWAVKAIKITPEQFKEAYEQL